MTYTLRFLPQVDDDAVAARRWYDAKSPGLGQDFLRTFYARLAEVQRSPFINRDMFRTFRRRLLRRFPYAIYFRVEGTDIIVFGVFHCARNPRSVKATLRERDDQ